MWLTFAIIILLGTLFVIFSKDLGDSLKEWWKKPWFKLFAPLFVASFIVIVFDPFLAVILNQLEVVIFKIMGALTSVIPVTFWSLILIEAGVIWILTMLPIIVIDRWFIYRYKTKRFEHKYLIAFIIWLLLACLYVNGMEIT